MELVKLTKVGRAGNPLSHFEHLQTGEFRIGLMAKEPEIGSGFKLFPAEYLGSTTRGIHTSVVQKVVSTHIFETFNTIYHLEVLNDQK